jgi:hypothetical protein
MTSIASVAIAKANGFRCFVLLTSDNVWLGEQTVKRFRDGLEHDGPLIASWDEWRSDPGGFGRDRIKHYLGDTGVVLISTKNVNHLENLKRVLAAAGARDYPAVILDDEADNASLDTSESKKGRGKYTDPSTIFKAIGDLRRAIPNHVYIQITATPQSLLLQHVDHPCRPVFKVISKPGETYIGGEIFFDADSALCFEFDPSEVEKLKTPRVNLRRKELDLPEGLRTALCCFFLASSHKRLYLGRDEKFSMLVHVSHKKIDHQRVGQMISNFVVDLDKSIRGKLSEAKKLEAEELLRKAWEELSKTAQLAPFPELLQELASTLRNAMPQIIDADNPKSEPEYRPGMNILIGGNRLGRGVTIEGLCITYYARDPKQKMMDTVHQHARMFGYRQELKDVTRFFVPSHILKDFKIIHDSDEAMRGLAERDGENAILPVLIGKSLKPTRSNVLNPAEVSAIPAGHTIWPADPLYKKQDVKGHTARLDSILSDYADDGFHVVPIAFLRELLPLMPSRYHEGYSWEDKRVIKALEAMEERMEFERGVLNVRTGGGKGLGIRRDPPAQGFTTGTWTNEAKAYSEYPVLIITKQAGKRSDNWDDQAVYVPTLIMPKGMRRRGNDELLPFAFVFNYSEE